MNNNYDPFGAAVLIRRIKGKGIKLTDDQLDKIHSHEGLRFKLISEMAVPVGNPEPNANFWRNSIPRMINSYIPPNYNHNINNRSDYDGGRRRTRRACRKSRRTRRKSTRRHRK